jgi:hypothetical protein
MTHVLLWSQRQNALHIEEVQQMLVSNRVAYRENWPTDYVALWMGSLEQCQATASNLQGTLAARSARPDAALPAPTLEIAS